MPRKSSRPSRTTQKSPTNFQKDSAPINNNQKPTLGSAVTQGVGIGAGVAIGNTMANAIFGNNKNINENENNNDQNTYTNTFDNITKVNNCFLEYNDFKKCMVENNSNLEFCKIYQEMLNICRKNVVL